MTNKRGRRQNDSLATSTEAQGGLATEAERNALARQAGKNAVIYRYLNGLAVTSTNLKTYPSVYGEFWDKVDQVT